MIFGNASGFLVLGFCLNLIAFSLNLIGFATPYWVKATSPSSITYIFGLWKLCKKSSEETVCQSTLNAPDWFRLVQSTGSIGFGCLLLVSSLLFFYVFILRRRNTIIVLICLCINVIAAISIFIAIVTFGSSNVQETFSIGDVALSDDLHFSFVLTVISMVTCAVAAGCLVFDYKYG
ncbi:uncharacterized protein LOC134265669 [Saccostrea cucullata]|uniref:uncharacterized protein LOC134265669 n=1 Tax=Saccostrea cuccullata TaxID=36930 RepID=UPI002ED65F8E